MRRSNGRRFKGTRTRKATLRKRAGIGSHLEDALYEQIRLAGLPLPDRQVRLIPGRRFTHDMAWGDPWRLALEVQGGEFLPVGAHTSGTGLARDCLKSALTQLEGYRALLVTGAMVRSGEALGLVEAFLMRSGAACASKTSGGPDCE